MFELFSFGKKNIPNSLNIYIKTNTGNTLALDLDPKWNIKNLKEILAPQLGLQPEEVKIIFAGKELGDAIVIEECDLGQQSILHAVKIKTNVNLSTPKNSNMLENSSECIGSKPLCETLRDLSTDEDSIVQEENKQYKAHFYVFCPTCKVLKTGKLRVRCHFCKSGAFTVHADPQNWSDVLDKKRITGRCENNSASCANVRDCYGTGGLSWRSWRHIITIRVYSKSPILNNSEPTFAEFYFKCAEHISLGEDDCAVPLSLIRPNLRDIPCLACADVGDPVFVFPCSDGHVTCLDCFRQYCSSRLRDRQFWQHPDLGYTLYCPTGCRDSFISEIHHFKLLTETQYAQYQKFATEEFVLQSGGVLCPQPDCGMGILTDPECMKISCVSGCGYVFCRLCLQGYHIGSCTVPDEDNLVTTCENDYNVDPARAAGARWDEASKITIKVLTKPCPKCRTPTERDGGCMHMVCTRAGCEFHWCWVCQTSWSRECMGSHWFG